MAFINTVLNRFTDGGLCWEIGRWEMDDGTKSGTIYPATTGNGITGGIYELFQTTFWSDGIHLISQRLAGNKESVDLWVPFLIASGDAGDYTLIGRMA